jgi:autotransporter-associated beta strand protein
MTVALGDATDNKIAINGVGGITISTPISGASKNLNKIGTGSGVLTLSVANTYSGTTTVTAGTLAVSGSGTVGTGNVSVASGATFDLSAITTSLTLSSTQTLSGAGTIAIGAKTLNVDGTISPGTSSVDTLAFTGAGTLQLSATSAFQFTLGTSSDLITLAGVLGLGSGVDFSDFTFNAGAGFTATTYTLISGASSLSGSLASGLSGSIGAYTGTLSLSGNNLVLTTVIAAVPEPHEYAFAIVGLLGLVIVMRRRKAAMC